MRASLALIWPKSAFSRRVPQSGADEAPAATPAVLPVAAAAAAAAASATSASALPLVLRRDLPPASAAHCACRPPLPSPLSLPRPLFLAAPLPAAWLALGQVVAEGVVQLLYLFSDALAGPSWLLLCVCMDASSSLAI